MTNTRAEVLLKWADGRYNFALKVPQIDELQRITAGVGAGMMAMAGVRGPALAVGLLEIGGVGAIWNRLLSGTYLRTDVSETIRLGLIGGGLDALRAKALIETYVDGKPLASREDVQAVNEGRLPDEMLDSVSNYGVALAVVNAAVYGLPEIDKGKDNPKGNAGAGDSAPATSMSPASTAPGAP